MQQRGIVPEDWGGDTITVPVSAVKGTGHQRPPRDDPPAGGRARAQGEPEGRGLAGVVIESQVDVGRGPLSTVIVQKGTLQHRRFAIVCGPALGQGAGPCSTTRAARSRRRQPSTPVRVIGWSGTPDSGATRSMAAKNAREAQNLADEEAHRLKQAVTTVDSAQKDVSDREPLRQHRGDAAEGAQGHRQGRRVFGSAEAVRQTPRGDQERQGVPRDRLGGGRASSRRTTSSWPPPPGATILGFSTKLENGVTPLAKHNGVRIETFEIIYELGDRTREMMADLLDPDIKEVKLGRRRGARHVPARQGLRRGMPRHRGQGEPRRGRPPAPRPRDRARGQGRPRSSASRTTPTRSARASSAA
jgi:translation initiation factor IF-2